LRKLRSVQVLRGVAALAVLLRHAHVFPGGAVGVDVFFVISGFIIATVMRGRTAAEFYRDRLRRIYPAYWVAMVPWLLLAIWGGLTTPERTLSSLTLWPVYSTYAEPYLRVAWTLSFEMLFYTAAALAILTSARVPLALFALCFAGNLIYPAPLLAFTGSPMIFEFLAGVALTKASRSEQAAVFMLPAALIAVALAPIFDEIGLAHPLSRIALWGIPSAAIVYSALSLERFVTRWVNWPVKLGDASYSLYLWHFLICALFPAVAAIPLSIAAAFASYRFIERPMLQLKPHVGDRRLGRAPMPAE
jgi:exopolysaccharide production protein ExoZ